MCIVEISYLQFNPKAHYNCDSVLQINYWKIFLKLHIVGWMREIFLGVHNFCLLKAIKANFDWKNRECYKRTLGKIELGTKTIDSGFLIKRNALWLRTFFDVNLLLSIAWFVIWSNGFSIKKNIYIYNVSIQSSLWQYVWELNKGSKVFLPDEILIRCSLRYFS